MDFWIDMSAAVLLRLLKDRREVKKYRAVLLKIAQAIQVAFANDDSFISQVTPQLKASE